MKTDNPGPIQLTKTQIDNYRVLPEFFTVRKWDDPIDQPFHGQGKNSAEAEARSLVVNRGSIRAQGDVNKALPPHTRSTEVEG